jgi:hypothetical protein
LGRADFILFPCPAARITAAVELIKYRVTSRFEHLDKLFSIYFSPTSSKNPFINKKQKKGLDIPLERLALNPRRKS